ncbi:CbtA family protein [Mycobacterium sp. OTB74]|uniref:CbtA family protein n=1 Tax=Mycobacterium sp. OTB74 TaxID=1853452 RepID=UPI0024749B3B|nr:CbtA family protein [Mycobacterium sp. OTB74]MDH6243677.1 putative cobalt transporter CbtA [Mycobacterium sp. OTB74]
MEIRVIGRGALAGLIAGILGFLFARIFAEPVIDKAIDYESGRMDVLSALNTAAGRPVEADGPELFSRSIQSTVGAATGIIVFSVAMGALVAVAYLVLHGRFGVKPKVLGWAVAGFGFLGVYLLPFVKYPANPPAIGHDFTIETRGELYLGMVAASLILLGLAVFAAHKLVGKLGWAKAVGIAVVGFFVVYGGLLAALPSLGDLSANVAHTDEFGFARAATETPQPIINILSTPVTVDGRVYAPGQIVYPGFDADLLWKFRWYSLINQVLIWSVIGVVFGALVQRFLSGATDSAAAKEVAAVA